MSMERNLGSGVVFPMGEKNDVFAQYFTGQSYLQMLTTERVGIANVTFEPSCRNNWHIHHKGGQFTLTIAYRKAPAKEIYVYNYTQIIFAALLGMMFLGQIPDWMSLLGYVVIIGSAFYKWKH